MSLNSNKPPSIADIMPIAPRPPIRSIIPAVIWVGPMLPNPIKLIDPTFDPIAPPKDK